MWRWDCLFCSVLCFVCLFVHKGMCVCVRREDAAGKRVEERFPAAGEKGKSHCAEELKSSRNSNNAFPAWATATTDPRSRYKQGKNAWEHRKEGRFMFVTSFCTRKKWRRDIKARRERYSKGVCGTLSELIDLLKVPGQRKADQSHYVSNGLNPKSNCTPRSLHHQLRVH